MKFVLARPVEEDAKRVMEWRNDPISLRFSNDSTPKKWPEFLDEFCSEYFSHPSLPPLFLYEGGVPVGFLRFRPAPEGAEISIMVDPEIRGTGIGKRALENLLPWAEKRGVEALVAEVKEGNEPSLKLFAGFEKIAPGRFIHRFRTKKPLFIIAEIGSNWKVGDELETARKMIGEAAKAGANAVKFQVFKAKTTYVEGAGKSEYLKESDIYELFQSLEMPEEYLPKLARWAEEAGVEFMASVFSLEDVKRVDPLVKRHKIASYEITHIPLIREVAKTGKPLILSTGAATPRDIALAVRAFTGDLTLLQCTAKYPAPVSALHLQVISWLTSTFGRDSGLSDHSQSVVAIPSAAAALGATVIEKHFTLDRSFPGPDQSFAITPQEFKQMVDAIREVEKALGDNAKRVLPEEEELFHFAQRRLQAARDTKKGEAIHLEILRPGNCKAGAHPIHSDEIEGKKANRDLKKGEGVTLDDIA